MDRCATLLTVFVLHATSTDRLDWARGVLSTRADHAAPLFARFCQYCHTQYGQNCCAAQQTRPIVRVFAPVLTIAQHITCEWPQQMALILQRYLSPGVRWPHSPTAAGQSPPLLCSPDAGH